MKPTTQIEITLDRISTREELVEVMDMLCDGRGPDRAGNGAFPAPADLFAGGDELSLESLEAPNDDRMSNELNSLTNMLLGEQEWVN